MGALKFLGRLTVAETMGVASSTVCPDSGFVSAETKSFGGQPCDNFHDDIEQLEAAQ
jgi:hypothetical protein